MVDWKKLEEEVEDAVNKKNASLVVFDSKTKEEWKYIQKYAEAKFSWIGIQISAIILILAIGISLIIAVDASKDLVPSIHNKDLKYIVYFVVGIIFMIYGAYLLFYTWKPEYNTCRTIILNTEKRILSEGGEPNQSQETTNPTPQVQENVPARNGNIGQIEYIKAKLDLVKIMISAIIGAIFVLVVYNVQTSGSNFILVLLAVMLLGILGIVMGRHYNAVMNELKDLT